MKTKLTGRFHWIDFCIYVYIYIYIIICMYMYMYVCVYIYIYIHICYVYDTLTHHGNPWEAHCTSLDVYIYIYIYNLDIDLIHCSSMCTSEGYSLNGTANATGRVVLEWDTVQGAKTAGGVWHI